MFGPKVGEAPDDDRAPPPRCDEAIYREGRTIFVLDDYGVGNRGVERWVRSLAEASGQRVDWHYAGGLAVVLYIGEWRKVRDAERRLRCPGRLMRIMPDPGPDPPPL